MSERVRDERPIPGGALSPQRLAALSAACLLIDDARLYGLIDGGPEVDREQCEAVLERLKREGIVPSAQEVESSAIALVLELSRS